jgi:hypothetical protein
MVATIRFKICYFCVSWSLALRGKHILKASENRVLRKVCGSKREEVASGWIKLHKEGLHDLYSSLNIIRVIGLREVHGGDE